MEEIRAKYARFQAKPLPEERGAAVLLPLVEREGEVCFLFEVRARTLAHQPGEICLPGGRMELGETAAQCALRETAEELGLREVEMISPLNPVRHSSGRTVSVFLGYLPSLEGMELQRDEVDEIFTVPLGWFRDHPPRQVTYTLVPDMEHAPEELKQFLPNYRQERITPLWVWQGHVIWGMTARAVWDFLNWID